MLLKRTKKVKAINKESIIVDETAKIFVWDVFDLRMD